MKETLEILALFVAILTPIIGSIYFLLKVRKTKIDKGYSLLASETWTNEGSINSGETRFIDLELELKKGELYGVLKSPRTDRSFEVYAVPNWFSVKLNISELLGSHNVPIANVKLKIQGNDNRLIWSSFKNTEPEIIPKNTELWPL